jgi:hypothetical protein
VNALNARLPRVGKFSGANLLQSRFQKTAVDENFKRKATMRMRVDPLRATPTPTSIRACSCSFVIVTVPKLEHIVCHRHTDNTWFHVVQVQAIRVDSNRYECSGAEHQDPDRWVREAVALACRNFTELQTIKQVRVRYEVDSDRSVSSSGHLKQNAARFNDTGSWGQRDDKDAKPNFIFWSTA